MRVALITEGTYPYQSGGASTWCRQLIAGLPRHEYGVVAITSDTGRRRPGQPLPPNVTALVPVPIWDRPVTVPGRLAALRHRRAATSAAVLLCRGILGDGPHQAAMFRDGLLRLARLTATGVHPLPGVPLAEVMLDAWRATRASTTAEPDDTDFRVPLPRLALRDAQTAAVLLEHALRPLAVTLPAAQLCHPVAGGLPLLVALAARWRTGTPYLLTEDGIYLRQRFVEYGDTVPEAVKAVMLRFFRALSRLGYAEAGLIASASRFTQRWQLRHGAQPTGVVVVPAGVDPAEWSAPAGPARPAPPGSGLPAPPTVVWVGRLEPLADLHTLIRAFGLLRRWLPEARLRLVGPTGDEGYATSCHALVRRLELRTAVEFAGPVAHASNAYASGHLVAHSGISEGTPRTVLEAMMCGRATVSSDVGGVAELVGDAGVVVPPGDPTAFATAMHGLLADGPRRHALGAAAAERARGRFTLDRMLRAYDQLYIDVHAENARAAGQPVLTA